MLAATFLFTNPAPVAMQDITGLLTGAGKLDANWGAYLEKSPAGSIHKAELAFVDTEFVTGAVPSGIKAPGLGDVVINGKAGIAEDTPDESRINRSDKRDRIVGVVRSAPPKAFNAGSVLERQSMLLRPAIEPGTNPVFGKPQIKGKEIAVAVAFYMKKPKPKAPDVPVYLADLVTSEQVDSLALGYAPPAKPDFARQSPFAALLAPERQEPKRFSPPILEGDHAWVATPLPAYSFSSAEQECLARGIYFEARGETVKGQAAVGQVMLNRVRNPTYPNSICGVVYQNQSWRNRCQFSFACDGIRDAITEPYRYQVAKEVAMAVTSGRIYLPEVGSSTHYHATYVNPRWAKTMEKMKKIGLHIFYRTHGGGWS
jgi:spore germination cell wall hydrolase CwlJ-like protein